MSRRGSPRGDADCTVVWVHGEHDLATRVSLAVAIARAARVDDVGLLIDLSAVTFMDASTVGALVGSRNRLRAHGQSLELRAPSAPALRILELCGLTGLIHRDAAVSTGASAALRTWVDVPPIDPRERTGREAAPVGTRSPSRQRAEPATADRAAYEAVRADGTGSTGG